MKKNTFTLVELLVVIGIIALLAGMLLPALNSARAKASAADCLSKTRQIVSAALIYSNDWNQQLPRNYASGKNVVGGWFQGGWNSANSWAGQLYTTCLNEPGVYICNDAADAPTTDGYIQRWNSRDPALSYSTIWEVGLRPTTRLKRASQAVYLFDNDYTSSYAVAEFAAKGTGDNALVLNDSLSHTNPNGASLSNNVDGMSLRNAFKEISEVHNGKMNAAFVDGHAGTFDPIELIDKNIASGSVLFEDYKRR